MKKTTLIVLFLIVSSHFFSLFANDIERRVDELINKMTLEEKIGQMNQVNHFTIDENVVKMMHDSDLNRIVTEYLTKTKSQQQLGTMSRDEKVIILKKVVAESFDSTVLKPVRQGNIGSILNAIDPEEVNKIQKAALEESRLGIPVLIARDVIHGFKTIFPIPLGQAASFNPDVVESGARVAAVEASSVGINWTFAPMLDISRDARWGRIAESLGEDPYLTGTLGSAMVRGFQNNGNLEDSHAIASCVKHFIGYGASEGGRDYNSTNIPPRLLRNIYLPPFKAALDAGALTLMTSFNDNDGVPVSGDKHLLRDILRSEWGFDGVVVSDWGSMGEMIPHGFAKDLKHVAEISANAGVDMEMVSGGYITHLAELVKEGKVSEKDIDEAVKNILRLKFKLGLFENPYVDTSKKLPFYTESHLQAARRAATESAILLKNDNNTLPLSTDKKVAIIGPMADAAHDQLGTWIFDGEKSHTITPIRALNEEYKHINYVYEQGLAFSRDLDTSNFEKVKSVVAESDVAIVFLGEEAILTGEAHSLSNINLIGKQSELLQVVKSVGKPVVLVIITGRPQTIERDLPYADAVLYNFHPGTMGGVAILDLLYGKANPSGKLPVTFVREVGQIPMHYNHNNTGRPAPAKVATLDMIEREAGQTSLGNTSFYLDSGKDPLFPFGYGLSYTSFAYSDIKLSKAALSADDELVVSAVLTNTGTVEGTEVAQLYVRDLVGSITRPIKELKGFQRITLAPGESKRLEFKLSAKDLAFYGLDLTKKVEAGEFKVWIGGDSNATLEGMFEIK